LLRIILAWRNRHIVAATLFCADTADQAFAARREPTHALEFRRSATELASDSCFQSLWPLVKLKAISIGEIGSVQPDFICRATGPLASAGVAGARQIKSSTLSGFRHPEWQCQA
jgi:hypothetical protein